MFIANNRRWDTRSGQHASGAFLLVFGSPNFDGGDRTLRACVRHVRMDQCGHWMMGGATVYSADGVSHRVLLSGTYGNDGLSIDAEKYPGLWEALMPIPPDLTAAFWAGGGHNSAGSEGSDMVAWARKNLRLLQQTARKGGKASV